jgi:hypothetical protein
MFREGEIHVRLALREHRIDRVDIASTRVALPAMLTTDRAPAEVVRTIPLLFSVCTQAQGAAAAGALDAAMGRMPPHATIAGRAEAVRQEAIIELLTRLLIDWPRALVMAPDVAAVARVRQARNSHVIEVCRSVAADAVYGVDAALWLGDASPAALERWVDDAATLPARCLQRLEREAADLGCSAVPLMPQTSVQGVFDVLPSVAAQPRFGQLPDWLGTPVETGSLARQSRHPLVAARVQRDGHTVAVRLLAQLVELASWLEAGDAAPAAVRQHAGTETDRGSGIGTAETARGLLVHQATVVDGAVKQYRIIAPTEWNFHPSGALQQALAGRAVRDAAAARRDAGWLVQALDPCVACDIEVADA